MTVIKNRVIRFDGLTSARVKREGVEGGEERKKRREREPGG